MQIVVHAKAQVTAKGKGKAEAESGADATAKADATPLVSVFNRPQRDVSVALTKPFYSKPGKTVNPKYPITLTSLKILNPRTLETLNAGPLTPSAPQHPPCTLACVPPLGSNAFTGCSLIVSRMFS
jgi:hypothetical protein